MSDYAAIEKEARIFTEECVTNNRIDPALFAQYDIKRGLRDKNGKGVLAGITNISRIDAFEERDGQKIPCDGKLDVYKRQLSSMMRASFRVASRSAMRASTEACSSLAASYSAFSLKSP